MTNIDKLNNVLSYVKASFVGKNTIIDLLGIGLVARENLFLLGPPGTAKSALVRRLSACIEDGRNFEYLLTRFTEPNEIFGPFDIRRLREGELITNTEGMMPEASLVFLDEIFNANSAILNSLLLALNERLFRRGKETRALPALMFVSASNLLPEDEALNALLDRFLIRVRCDYVDPDLLHEVLLAGWQLDAAGDAERPAIRPEEIRALQAECRRVDLSAIRQPFVDLVHNLRSTGIKVSDRRAVKLQSLIAASAVLSGRTAAVLSDLWVLRYIWDTEEQVAILGGIVDKLLEGAPSDGAHPQARANRAPDPEELMREVQLLQKRWAEPGLSFEEQNVVKDKLRYMQTRAHWVQHADHKQFIQTEIERLWQQMLQTV